MPKLSARRKILLAKILVTLAVVILAADFIYKTIHDITAYNKQQCVLYLKMPRPAFLFYEYFLELFFIVLTGVFIAVLLESWFTRFRQYYPANPLTAFLYASVLPVCSCTVIPVIKSMEGKLNMRTLVTFIIAAPLLNPYIIVLSYSILGFKYGTLRIVCSFLLAWITATVVAFSYRNTGHKLNMKDIPARHNNNINCTVIKINPFLQTYKTMMTVLPYLVFAGVLGIAAEYWVPVDFLKKMDFTNNGLDLLLVIAIGVPLYYCNGADVVLLKPLIGHSGLSLGTAMAFSLTSTAICITALVMLVKFLGKKLTLVLTAAVIVLTFIMGYIINLSGL